MGSSVTPALNQQISAFLGAVLSSMLALEGLFVLLCVEKYLKHLFLSKCGVLPKQFQKTHRYV